MNNGGTELPLALTPTCSVIGQTLSAEGTALAYFLLLLVKILNGF